jgi:hypothetical protein
MYVWPLCVYMCGGKAGPMGKVEYYEGNTNLR